MKPHEFVQALLNSRGLSPTAVARAAKKSTSQGTFARFLAGGTSDPRMSWVRPIAKELQISPEAFMYEEAADREAKRLGISATKFVAMSPAGPYRVKAQARIDAGLLALQIADVTRSHDPAVRAAAAALFAGAATNPDEAPSIATRLRGLLSEPVTVLRKTAGGE